MQLSTCVHCGEPAVSKAGRCSCCGTINFRTVDGFSLALSIVGLVLHIPFILLARTDIFFALEGTVHALVLILSAFIPLSISADGVFVAYKRRKERKTMFALVLGIIGGIVGVILLIHAIVSQLIFF